MTGSSISLVLKRSTLVGKTADARVFKLLLSGPVAPPGLFFIACPKSDKLTSPKLPVSLLAGKTATQHASPSACWFAYRFPLYYGLHFVLDKGRYHAL